MNNFSEVSNELLDEIIGELENGDAVEAKVIASLIKQNLEKIAHHGKRADAIVKGMLQHSRTSTGQKEDTDINALADEYLRLAYHGLRVKNKSFQVQFETGFDPSIGKIKIVPQDMGRVILNMINNAFYAASLPRDAEQADRVPMVVVNTKKEGNKILITIKDNGPGIPANILDKIFQPFFTTKPPGEGTGLGLSLAYDIVKSHGGDTRVQTDAGQGTEFAICLVNA